MTQDPLKFEANTSTPTPPTPLRKSDKTSYSIVFSPILQYVSDGTIRVYFIS